MVSWQQVRDWGLGLYKKRTRSRTLWIGGSSTFFGLLIMIAMLTGVSETHSGDRVMNPDGTAEVYVNITTIYWRICFDDTFKFVTTLPYVSEEIYVPTYGKKWRLFNPKKDCIDRKKINRFMIKFYNITETVKWSFVFDKAFTNKINIDPVIIGYQYIYKNFSKEVPVYQDNLVEVKPVYSSLNGTWSKGYNYTKKELIDYKTEYYTKEGILNRKGIKIGNKNLQGYYSVCGNYLVHRLYNPGDLNEDEFCRCRQYVIGKGLCSETNLLEVTKIEN